MEAIYRIIKKSAGYGIKRFSDIEKARKYAADCCRINNNDDFGVFVENCGIWEEI